MQKKQKLQHTIVLSIFLLLGAHVGVYAVLLADLAAALNLSNGSLGFVIMFQTGSGIVGLLLGGQVANRLGRRAVLLIGMGGTGLFFVTLALANEFKALIICFILGGICISFFDLIANTAGGDYESNYKKRVLPLSHAFFSAGAATSAVITGTLLSQHFSYQTIYMSMGLLLALSSILIALTPFQNVKNEGKKNAIKNTFRFKISSISKTVLFAATIICTCFFIDGALQGYLSLYLRNILQSGSFYGGLGIALLHTSTLVGRISYAAITTKFKDYIVLTCSGILATIGLTLVVVTANPIITGIGLLLIGFGLSPIAPMCFSLATKGDSAGRAKAVSFVTLMGYLSFTFSPVVTGSIAEASSLRMSFFFLLIASLVITLVAVRGKNILSENNSIQDRKIAN